MSKVSLGIWTTLTRLANHLFLADLSDQQQSFPRRPHKATFNWKSLLKVVGRRLAHSLARLHLWPLLPKPGLQKVPGISTAAPHLAIHSVTTTMFPSITLLGKSNRLHSEVSFGFPRGSENCQWKKQGRRIVKNNQISILQMATAIRAPRLLLCAQRLAAENRQDRNKKCCSDSILRPLDNKSLCNQAWKKPQNSQVHLWTQMQVASSEIFLRLLICLN